MSGAERRDAIIELLTKTHEPLSGTQLGKQFGVSRQVIVQDIALLRNSGIDILSTNRGYLLTESINKRPTRLFKLHHSVKQTQEELECIISLGGCVEDVLINHRMYGKISAPMNISNRTDIQHYLNDIATGVSTPLLSATSGYHFHHVSADSEKALDKIEIELSKKGLLAQFLPYEKHFG